VVRAGVACEDRVMMPPFRGGRGGLAGVVQSLVRAGAGGLAPVFASIEEYRGRNTGGYYAVFRPGYSSILAKTGASTPARASTRDCSARAIRPLPSRNG